MVSLTDQAILFHGILHLVALFVKIIQESSEHFPWILARDPGIVKSLIFTKVFCHVLPALPNCTCSNHRLDLITGCRHKILREKRSERRKSCSIFEGGVDEPLVAPMREWSVETFIVIPSFLSSESKPQTVLFWSCWIGKNTNRQIDL